MKYLIYTNKDGRIDILDKYESEDKALKRLKFHMKKEKGKLEVIPMLDIEVGCILYRSDGTYYRTISSETDCLWLVTNNSKPEGIPDPYSKSRAEQWIISKDLVVARDPVEAVSMIDMKLSIGQKVDMVMKSVSIEQLQLV